MTYDPALEAARVRTERYYLERDTYEITAREMAALKGLPAPDPVELRDRAHEACKHLLPAQTLYDGIRGEVQKEQAEANAAHQRRSGGGIIYQ